MLIQNIKKHLKFHFNFLKFAFAGYEWAWFAHAYIKEKRYENFYKSKI